MVSRLAALNSVVVVYSAVMVDSAVLGCIGRFVWTAGSYEPDPSAP